MNNSKCNKCGLVNPGGDLACRRCGRLLGLPVRKSFSEQKTTYPRYLFLLPFLLLALGFGYWSSEIKKNAIESMNVDKPEWHELTMDPKVNRKDPPKETKPRDPFERYRPQMEEMRKQKFQPVVPIKVPQLDQPSHYKKP